MPCGCNKHHSYTKEKALVIAGCMARCEGRNYWVYEGVFGWNFTYDYDIVKKYENKILVNFAL